ncbi:MAG TPA: metallophosphoesterase [Fimbriimonadaceae bacterium]|nr:metallophosphoesterase [Fimbriimonadaceae bacterium]
MGQNVQILHLSDLHANEANRLNMRIRLEALFQDLDSERVHPDIVVFAGDLAFSGLPAEYELAQNEFLCPLLERLGLSKDSLVIVPGNHDVCRADINKHIEIGLRADLTTTAAAESVLFGDESSLARLHNYLAFARQLNDEFGQSFYTLRRNIAGLDVGIAALNTAWRCSSDDDKGYLFITEKQVVEVTEKLKGCDITIAAMHHPIDWLHHTEQEIVIPDLRNSFNLMLTGHIHEANSESVTSTTASTLHITAPAVSDGKNPAGYNVYSIELADKILRARYRKFIRNGRRYDANTEHAMRGEATFPLPISNLERFSRTLLVQRIGDAGTAMQKEMNELLAKHQPTGRIVYVTPSLREIKIVNGERSSVAVEPDISTRLRRFNFLTGPAESGKSILCHSIAATVNTNNACSIRPNLAIFIDLKRNAGASLKSMVAEATRKHKTIIGDANIVIVLDNIYEGGMQHCNAIQELARANPKWRFVVSISSKLVFETLLASQPATETLFLELRLWGPSRIRQVASHVLDESGIDVQAAFEFVVNSLKVSDLPPTPLIIFMYLSVFAALEGQVTSLSYLHLLQEYERLKFGNVANSGSKGLYNKQKVLAKLAARMIEMEDSKLPRVEAIAIIEKYFQTSFLDVSARAMLDEFVESGVLAFMEDNVSLICMCFLTIMQHSPLMKVMCQ